MKFVPFHDIPKPEKCLAVDCTHRKALPLSHWKEAGSPPKLHDDTSTAITLNAIKSGLHLEFDYVTNNHFDIDGFLGVWSLLNPELGLQHEEIFRQAALIGDFRELPDLSNSDNLTALKLVCLINTLEKKLFYAPFEAQDQIEKESKACVEKYQFFNSKFNDYLFNHDNFEHLWIDEFQKVIEGNKNITSIIDVDHIRLKIVTAAKPSHYYSLFKGSENSDMVLTIYPENRYELEYKYTTWVDTNRISFPRVDMTSLIDTLNSLEKNKGCWTGDKITDTGPILRLSNESLSKAECFDHPFNRPIHKSSIDNDTFINTVISFYEDAYKHITPKIRYTWKEIKEWNINKDKIQD
ncbi:DUF6687 family protein [Marinigracilibium pacificum]|uniref:Uncharacterized protein n=1 Tax=Marinigracilibium pacificum TaxID=2729599 RepID=A0A848IU46_9BACT|nr:DUF6687 family protein [Marinigracilibium pacificum]NMM46825.1 hypothetical protein [Marinigracilibium pacificum]